MREGMTYTVIERACMLSVHASESSDDINDFVWLRPGMTIMVVRMYRNRGCFNACVVLTHVLTHVLTQDGSLCTGFARHIEQRITANA